jgi:hypothetical protein
MPAEVRGALVIGGHAPWRACLARACPSPQGKPAGVQRAACQAQGKKQATAPSSPAREGAAALRSASGAAVRVRCRPLAPSGRKLQTDLRRAGGALPPDNVCGVGDNRLAVAVFMVQLNGPRSAERWERLRGRPQSLSTVCS